MYPISGPVTLVTISMSGFEFPWEARLTLLKPRPTNHILNEAFSTSSSEGPFFLNQPRLNTEGNFKRSHLPKPVFPKRPMQIPTMMIRRMPSKDFVPIFTPKWAGFTDDQKASLFSTTSELSFNPVRPFGFSVRIASVLRTTAASAEGSFTAQRPIFFWFSIVSPLEGGGPGIYNNENRIRLNEKYYIKRDIWKSEFFF